MNFNHMKIFIFFILIWGISGCGGSSTSTSNTNTGSLDTSSSKKTDSNKPNVIIIFTDDMGYADLGIQDQRTDIKTPNIDSIANNGVRMTHGYVTAPQCTPSRAALLSGQYQQRFGMDDSRYAPMPLNVKTLGEYFQGLGYITGMAGKWHLEVGQNSKEWLSKNYPNIDPKTFKTSDIPLEIRKKYFPNNRGYTDTYFGYRERYWTTVNNNGESKEESYVRNNRYRMDVVSDAAIAFIKKHHDVPFYYHVAYFAPHVPLEATEKYLNRFPNIQNQRRKYALAMMSAVDDGVGRILDTLKQENILDNTIIFFISDNGAPLGLDMTDSPISDKNEAWDGSMNTPLIGEKGMLTDGGIRIPYLMQWPKNVQGGLVIDKPVSSLDASYTVLKACGASESILKQLDGLDLLPAIDGNQSYLEQRALFWHFWNQSAVRVGQWKYIKAGKNLEYLFDMYTDENELVNRISSNPEIVKELKGLLDNWENSLQRRQENEELNLQEKAWYNYFLN